MHVEGTETEKLLVASLFLVAMPFALSIDRRNRPGFTRLHHLEPETTAALHLHDCEGGPGHVVAQHGEIGQLRRSKTVRTDRTDYRYPTGPYRSCKIWSFVTENLIE